MPSTFLRMRCYSRNDNALQEVHTVVLTEGGGGVSSNGAGHEEVGDLAQGEEAGWVISLVHLLLDQAFQLVLKRLTHRKSGLISTPSQYSNK